MIDLISKNRQERFERAIVLEGDKKTYRERVGMIYIFLTYILLPLLIVWSIITEASFVGSSVYKATGSFVFSAIVASMSVIIVEGIKIAIGSEYIKFIVNKWAIGGVHYFIAFLLSSFLVIFAFGGSAIMSVKGTPITIQIFGSYIPVANQHDLGLIDSQIAEARATKWKGTTTSTSQKAIKSLTVQREKALIENQRLIKLNEDKLSSIGLAFSAFGGYLEFAAFVCLLFAGFYKKYSYDEIPESRKAELRKSTPNEQPEESSQNQHVETIQKQVPESPANNQIETNPSSSEKRSTIEGFGRGWKQASETQVGIVAQQVTSPLAEKKTIKKQEKESNPIQVQKTVVLVDSNQEIDVWKKYARTYWNRSQKSATEKTRNKNLMKYLQYKELLVNSGLYNVTETVDRRGKKQMSIDKK